MPSEARRVLVAGAGVAGLETALALQAIGEGRVSVELVAPEKEFTYRPLAVAEPFRVGDVRRFPLDRLVGDAGAQLRRGRVIAVDAEEKLVTLDDDDELGYDVLVLALGARPRASVAGALSFSGPQDRAALVAVLDRATAGELKRIVFAVPTAPAWPLPLYELAFLTGEYLTNHMTRGVEIVLTTPEDRPLALFGPAASEAIAALLEIRGIRLETGVSPERWEDGVLYLDGDRRIEADVVVALPRLEGQPIAGVAQDGGGFVATDELGWVLGLTDVYAAGDLTQFPVKQGGIAAQQADAVASAIAADAGANVRPATFKPVLRGLLLTGFAPRFLRSEGGVGPSLVDTQPLWWPPAKIVGRYLSPFLATHLGLAAELPEPPPAAAVPVDVALDMHDRAAWSSV
jgi:sulfide:quinone oxidoreductase